MARDKIFVWNVNAHLMAAMFVLVGFRVNGEAGISKVSNTSCILYLLSLHPHNKLVE